MPDQKFHSLARRVAGRLTLARWLQLLGSTAVYLFPALLALAVAGYFTGLPWLNIGVAVALVAGWLLATGLWVLAHRPDPVAALAYWDKQAGRSEMFTSALWFERTGDQSVGQQLHMQRASERLEKEAGNLSKDVPLAFSHHSWIMPSMFLMLVGFVLVSPAPSAVDDGVREDDILRAQTVAETLEQEKEALNDKQGLTEEEQKKLDELKENLDETVQKLEELSQETQKEILSELEQRALEAEKLAAELGDAGQALSSEMLAELARHVDTAALANAMIAQNLKQTAEEAQKIGDKLQDEASKPTLEEQQRLELALEKSLEKASPEDLQSQAGQNFTQAEQFLSKNEPRPAGDEFKKLGERAQQAQQRENAQKKLQELAKQLRNSGQKIFNQKQLGLRQLANNSGSQLRQLGQQQPNAQQLQPLPNMPLQQSTAPASNMPMPNMPPGQLAKANPNATPNLGQPPVPGQLNPNMTPSNCQGGNCPIPGSKPGQPGPPKLGNGQCQGGNCPIPGTSPGMSLSLSQSQGNSAKQGGLLAGNGSTQLANNNTNPFKASSTETVQPPPQGEGPSEFKQVEGAMHQEATARTTKEVAIDLIQSQEEALDDEPISFTRREQVRRYFETLRNKLQE